MNKDQDKEQQEPYFDTNCFQNNRERTTENYKLIYNISYPFDPYDFENKFYRDLFLVNEIKYLLQFSSLTLSNTIMASKRHLTEEEYLKEQKKEELENFEKKTNNIDMFDCSTKLIFVDDLCEFKAILKLKMEKNEIIQVLKSHGFEFTLNYKYLIYKILSDDESLDHDRSNSERSYSYYSDSIAENSEQKSDLNDEHFWDETNNNDNDTTNCFGNAITFGTEQYWDIDLENTPQLPSKMSILPENQFEDASDDEKYEKCQTLNDSVQLDDSSTSSEHSSSTKESNMDEKNDFIILSSFPGYNYNSIDAINFGLNIRPKYRKKRKDLRRQKTVEFSQFDD
jgi:hypothetical protein